MHSIRLRFVTPAQPPRYAAAHSPAAAGRRRPILLGFLCGFLLSFAASPVRAQVDDHNPVGVTWAFEGVTTTGCAYNVLHHNGSASAEDPSKYDIQLHMKSGTSWGSYFYAGG